MQALKGPGQAPRCVCVSGGMRPPFHLLRIVQGEQVDLGMVAWLIERKRHTLADTCSSPHSPTGCLGTSTSNQGELAGTASPNISRPAPTSLSLLHPHTAFFLDAGGARVRVSTPQQGQSWQRSWTSNPDLCRFCCPAAPEPAPACPGSSGLCAFLGRVFWRQPVAMPGLAPVSQSGT